MSRYIQQPRKEKKKEKPRTLPKPGSYGIKLTGLKKESAYASGR